MMTERALLRVEKGRLVPADGRSVELLRERGYHVGDVLSAELRKPRNSKYHRLAHAFGQLCADNIERFSGINAHDVLKVCQLEADIACRHMRILLTGEEMEYRVPESLSYESMDQGRFEGVFKAMCQYVSDTYWPTLTAEQIAAMAELMVEAA